MRYTLLHVHARVFLAVSRIMLNGSIDNIQMSWVKEGPKMAVLNLLVEIIYNMFKIE